MGPTTIPPPAKQMPLEPAFPTQSEPRSSSPMMKALLVLLLVLAVPVALAVVLLMGMLLVRGGSSVSTSDEAAVIDSGFNPIQADETFSVRPATISPAAFLESKGRTTFDNSVTVTDLEMLAEIDLGSDTFRTFYAKSVASDGTIQSCAGLSGFDGTGMTCGPSNPFDSEIGATRPPTEPAILDVTHNNQGTRTLAVVLPPGELVHVMQVTTESGWVAQGNFVGDPSGYQSAIVAWDAPLGSNAGISFYTADGQQVWSDR